MGFSLTAYQPTIHSYDTRILDIQLEQFTATDDHEDAVDSNGDKEYEIEPEDELLIHNYNTLPENCKKFWKKRYKLFSKFDEGIYMSSDMWFSVTPEALALFTAKLVRKMLPQAQFVLDVCCGAGGNAIQLATEFEYVVAIDINHLNIVSTIQNAGVYGVRNRVWCIEGDWIQMSDTKSWLNDTIPHRNTAGILPFDFVFSSPPWGGTEYHRKSYDLNGLQPLPLAQLLELLARFATNFGLFLPRLLNTTQLSEITSQVFGKDAKCRVVFPFEGLYVSGALAFWGPAVTSNTLDYSLLVDPDYLIPNATHFNMV